MYKRGGYHVAPVTNYTPTEKGRDLPTLVESYGKLDIIISDNPSEIDTSRYTSEYEMASLAKLSILLYAVDVLDYAPLRAEKVLTLKSKHIRAGTGILRYFTPGFQLKLLDALHLMIIESDNTATNMVLEELGGSTHVIEHLRVNYSVDRVGLAPRDDLLFESDVATAGEMFIIWTLLCERIHASWPDLAVAFGRSHVQHGIRSLIDAQSGLGYGRTLLAGCKLAGKLKSHSLQSIVLYTALERGISVIRAKEGVLDLNGEGYRHEVAIFFTPAGEPIYVGFFSGGWPELGYTVNHPAWSAVRLIGRYAYKRYMMLIA